jgi:hypothetical protein
MSKVRIPVVLPLFTVAAMLEAVRLSSLSALSNSDVWWHLTSGLRILHNHALPHTGLFSQSSALPWIASSWGYDVLLAGSYKLLELRSIPILLMCFKTALAVMTFLLAGGLRGRFWLAVILSALAQYILSGFQPGPVYLSILCFAVELLLLMESRRTRSARPLFWLPPLFFVWANVDARFVDGLVLLLVFLAAVSLEILARKCNGVSVPARMVGLTALLSGIATLCTPYFWRPYAVFFASVASSAKGYFPDFRAMSFRQPQDYLLLLLTMSAFLALGMRHSRDPFLLALLAGSAVLSFYAQRDTWIVTLTSIAIIAESIPELREAAGAEANRAWRWEIWATAGLVLAVLVVTAMRIPRSRDALFAKIGESYPVQASMYIREHSLPEPLFNAYEWGGFLDWYLPEYPVAIDGRADLYGDDFMIQYSKAMNADVPYSAFPAMKQARTLLLPAKSLMGQALRTVSGFKVEYSDNIAVVLIKQE